MPQKTHIDQEINIQEQQVLNEQTLALDLFEKPHTMATKSYEQCDLLSRTSLERVSPQRLDDEVTILIVNQITHNNYINNQISLFVTLFHKPVFNIIN